MIVIAHGGELVGPHDLPFAWSWDPLVLVALILTSAWYRGGVRSLWSSAGHGSVVSTRQVAAFWTGNFVVFVALVSPLDPLSSELFSAHMSQHVLLTLVAAPLFVLSAPLQTMAWGLPSRLRRRTGRWQGRVRRLLGHPALPAAGLACSTAVFTLWHLPALYNTALRNEAVHALEHVTMLGSSLALWAPIIRPRRSNAGAGVVLLFLAMIAGGVLAALLVFAPAAWYAHTETSAWGLTPLQDQQVAGAVMWVFGGGIYIVTGAMVLIRWLHLDEELAERRERHQGSSRQPSVRWR